MSNANTPVTNIRTFVLRRAEDETGVSGTGIVAEGCEFSHGMCAVTWMTPYRCVNVYESIKAVEAVHGHNGKTLIEWVHTTRLT